MLDLYINIRQLRKDLGLSQQELAEKLGYNDRSSIAKIESGNVDLPQSKIEAFAKVLGVKASELMGWTDDPLPDPVLCAGGKLPEDDIKFQEAVAYTLRKLKELTTLKDAQNLNHFVQLYDRLDDIDKGKIAERMETMLEADKYK